jgi:hypothetical protein
MGWSIHRIWSSDWVSDSRREVSKVLDKFAELRAVPGIAQGGERDSIGMANLRSEGS